MLRDKELGLVDLLRPSIKYSIDIEGMREMVDRDGKR